MNKKVFEKLPVANERHLTEFIYKYNHKYYLTQWIEKKMVRTTRNSEIIANLNLLNKTNFVL